MNYAGVVIGPDLRFDIDQQRSIFDRANYFDSKVKENSPRLGLKFSDDDLLEYVINIYGVLLTRGIKGTYVYIGDPDLRNYLAPYFTAAGTPPWRADAGIAPARKAEIPVPGGRTGTWNGRVPFDDKEGAGHRSDPSLLKTELAYS
ncbi:hypothetical protein GCM10009672_22360 [Nesterenkonia lutea]